MTAAGLLPERALPISSCEHAQHEQRTLGKRLRSVCADAVDRRGGLLYRLSMTGQRPLLDMGARRGGGEMSFDRYITAWAAALQGRAAAAPGDEVSYLGHTITRDRCWGHIREASAWARGGADPRSNPALWLAILRAERITITIWAVPTGERRDASVLAAEQQLFDEQRPLLNGHPPGYEIIPGNQWTDREGALGSDYGDIRAAAADWEAGNRALDARMRELLPPPVPLDAPVVVEHEALPGSRRFVLGKHRWRPFDDRELDRLGGDVREDELLGSGVIG